MALLKIVMHARSGGRLEVMGLMLGKIDGSTMVVMDTFALPVEGTETRVNAQAAAYEYMSTYIESAKQVDLFIRNFIHHERGPISELMSAHAPLLLILFSFRSYMYMYVKAEVLTMLNQIISERCVLYTSPIKNLHQF